MSNRLSVDSTTFPRKAKSRSLVHHLVSFILATLALSVPAIAQNKLSFASDMITSGQLPTKECLSEIQVFTRLAIQFPHPTAGWSFIIVCDEMTWLGFMRRILPHQDLWEHYGETDIDKNITLIRGYKLLYPDRSAPAEHIVAHELAHIMLHTRDEEKVDEQAVSWIAQQKNNFPRLRDGEPPQRGSNLAGVDSR